MKPCDYTEEGYCIRQEGDYCPGNECQGCDHHMKSIVNLFAACGCETTVEVCQLCKKQLTEPKTDC